MLNAGQDCPDRPTMPSPEVRKLRVSLIAEELAELCQATGVELVLFFTPKRGLVSFSVDCCVSAPTDIVEAYDALLDIEVVTTGSAVAMGLETEPGWQEVHRSNMSKFIDGHRREDGKWMKGPSSFLPNLKPIIEQLQNHDEKHTPTGE